MDTQPIQHRTIQQIAAELKVSIEDVRAVAYGEGYVHGEKLLRIIDRLANDGRGVYVCAVWKGDSTETMVQNLPRYDYYGEIIQGLNLYLHTRGYTSRLLVNSFHLADYTYFESLILRRPSVGLINIASHFAGDLRKACENHHRPLVFMDYPAGEDTTNQYIISMKSEAVIAEVVGNLYRLGHRRIAFIQGPQDKQTAVDRYKGYRAGLAEFGIELDGALVLGGNWDITSGKAAAEQFMVLSSPPTAIIASNDLMALGVMQAAEQQGLKIPNDISVVGFDDIAQASMTTPALSSVRTPMTQMGSKAGEYIVSLLEGEAPFPYQVDFPLSIMMRESTGPAPSMGE